MPERKLSDLTLDEFENTIKCKIDEGLIQHRSDFYIEPETHYNDHKAIGEFFTNLHEMGKTARRVVVTTIVSFLIMAMATGVVYAIVRGGV